MRSYFGMLHPRKNRWPLFGVTCVLMGLSGCGSEPGDAPAHLPRDGNPQVAALLEPIARQHGIPALAGAVVTGAGLQAAAAVGFRKWGETAPVTVDDRWHLGSDTKAMAAVLVARQVEAGKLRWDTPVAELFPDLASEFHPEARAVTVEQLLMHRAGVAPNLDWAPYARAKDGDVRHQRLDATRRALAKRPSHPPGSHYVYSNLGYVVCGALLERVTGQAWEQLIEQDLFRPLGMLEVGQGGMGTVGKLDQPWGHTASGKPVRGYGPDQDNPRVLGPAGRAHASLASWALFIADQLRGARGAPALLQPGTYARLHQRPPGGEYALGWLVVSREWGGGLVLSHAGCNTMHYAVAWVAPKKDFAVLICANQGDDRAAKATDEAAAALIKWHTETSETE
ncbi:MAG: beta-lactamase family protein [Verrucomicrobia bacterium]|nr:beta-lactamase family protein [Verrucomicrobiota bacterium]